MQWIDRLNDFTAQIADCFDIKQNSKGDFDLSEIISKAMTAAKSSVLYNDSLLLWKKLTWALKIPVYSNVQTIIENLNVSWETVSPF